MIGQAGGADLSLPLQLKQRSPVILDGAAVLGRPMHLVEIDPLDLQPPQRRFGLAADAVGRADAPRRRHAILFIPHQPAFGEDQRPRALRHVPQRLRDDLFGMAEPVDCGGVDPVDAARERVPDGGDRILVVL
jgi:hypothetical protein